MKRIVSLGTFMDASNIYVRKAYAAGITTGTSATEFSPNAALTSQQMATFIYRAFMYVRDNSVSAIRSTIRHWATTWITGRLLTGQKNQWRS